MHEAEDRVAALAGHLARLEAQLGAQRQEMAALRAELWRLQQGVPSNESVAHPPKPEASFVPPPIPPPPQPVALPPVWPTQPAGPSIAAQLPPNAPAAPPSFSAYAPSPAASKHEARRSLENRIGSQFFNRIGIAAVLIGVALFLKLAYDRHWIHTTPAGRITGVLVVGAVIVLWSERFRRKGYAVFSYSLKAIGSGALYMALWASFHIYHLLPAGVVLSAMIGVTAWNAIMAWMQDAELLAAYALIGGFATPALVGSGGNHEVFLFSYILAMDVAVLLLLTKKPWQRLLLGSFPGTVIYSIGWYLSFFTPAQAGITGLFVLLLAAPFAAVALMAKQREAEGEGLLAPLAAASFLAVGLYTVLENSGHHVWLPWFAVALGAVYLILMRVRRNGIAEPVHLALAIIFLTIAIPLKAEGRWITIGWLAEGVALLWVAAKLLGPEVQLRVRALMRWLGCIALGLGVAESLVFWVQQDAQNAFWNARFWTEMSAVAALAVAAWLARNPAREDAPAPALSAPSWSIISVMTTLAAHIVAPLAVARELAAYWSIGASADAAYRQELSAFSIAAFLMVYGTCLIAWVALREKSNEAPGQRTMLRVLGSIYVTVGSLAMIVTPIVGDGGPLNVFWNARLLLEMIGAAALAATALLAWRAYRICKITTELWVETAIASLLTFNLLVVLTGVHEIFTYFGVRATGDASLVESFSISAWLMLYAAILLAAGFWKRTAFVRWQGLGLMVFTIGKVFLYDMHTLSSGYRVLSVFGLGALLMAVSFVYQKDWLALRDPSADGDPRPDEAAQ